jgi:hypothetical protein
MCFCSIGYEIGLGLVLGHNATGTRSMGRQLWLWLGLGLYVVLVASLGHHGN